jgi:hypothetical protein
MVVQPEKTSENLVTYMEAFWTLTGVVSIGSAAVTARFAREQPGRLLGHGHLALADGLLLIGDALLLRRQLRDQKRV